MSQIISSVVLASCSRSGDNACLVSISGLNDAIAFGELLQGRSSICMNTGFVFGKIGGIMNSCTIANACYGLGLVSPGVLGKITDSCNNGESSCAELVHSE